MPNSAAISSQYSPNLDTQLSHDHNHVYSRQNEKGSIRYDIPVSQEVFCRRSVVSDVNDHSSSGQLGIECVQGYSRDDVVWRPELGTLGSRRERRHRACEVCVSPFTPHINTYTWFSLVRILRSYEHGINTFDTADIYSNGLSEIYLGKAIKALNLPREGIVVMTKVYDQSRRHMCRKVPSSYCRTVVRHGGKDDGRVFGDTAARRARQDRIRESAWPQPQGRCLCPLLACSILY